MPLKQKPITGFCDNHHRLKPMRSLLWLRTYLGEIEMKENPNDSKEYPNCGDDELSEILILVERKYGSGALFAVADLLEGYDDG